MMLYFLVLLALLLTSCDRTEAPKTDTDDTSEYACVDHTGQHLYQEAAFSSCLDVISSDCSFDIYYPETSGIAAFGTQGEDGTYALEWAGSLNPCTSADFETWTCEQPLIGGTSSFTLTRGTCFPEDLDQDGVTADEDCDDSDASTYPGADELCDGTDNDCDGDIDEEPVDASAWYADTDGDGQGDTSDSLEACTQPDGYVDNSDDPYPLDPFEGARLVRMHPAIDAAPSVIRHTAQETGSATVRVTAGLARDECGSNDGILILLQKGSEDILTATSQKGGDLASFEGVLALTAGDQLTLRIHGNIDNYCDWGAAAFTIEQGDRLYDAGYDYSTDKGQQGYKGWQYMFSATLEGPPSELVPGTIGTGSDTHNGWVDDPSDIGAHLFQFCGAGDVDCDGIADKDDATPDDAHQP